MLLFFVGLALLVIGYFTYGRMVEKILEPDDRKTPALMHHDGVDFMVLPHWKNMLIQLLNIAGVGPVIGVIAGIKFGPIVFLLIPIGNIIGGATHDFVAGMASLRNRGTNLPNFVQLTLGNYVYRFFSVFVVFLLLLVVAVFINIPANLIDGVFLPHQRFFWGAVCAIFAYYVIATMFPVDKIIGSLYPIFGGLLLIGSGALLVALVLSGIKDPSILLESEKFVELKNAFLENNPIIPCLFVTIACGILSGFHATQSPIIARTMKSEYEARSSFYGMMVLEGVIAMIWAAGAMAIYNMNPELWAKAPAAVLPEITSHFLGKRLGSITVVAVIILAITSGDTAMRSMRLSLAEILKINQKPFMNRFFICLPLIAIVAVLLWWSNADAKSFGKLWNYFAWGNQALAVFTLGGACVWLLSKKRPGWIAAVPGAFMTFIVVSFILWTSEAHKGPAGFGFDLKLSYAIGAVVAVIYMLLCFKRGKMFARNNIVLEGTASQPADSAVEASAEAPVEAVSSEKQ